MPLVLDRPRRISNRLYCDLLLFSSLSFWETCCRDHCAANPHAHLITGFGAIDLELFSDQGTAHSRQFSSLDKLVPLLRWCFPSHHHHETQQPSGQNNQNRRRPCQHRSSFGRKIFFRLTTFECTCNTRRATTSPLVSMSNKNPKFACLKPVTRTRRASTL